MRHFVAAFMLDLHILDKPAVIITRAPSSRPTQWLPPSVSLAKINVDASVARSSGFGAVAAVSRDHAGVYSGASVIIVFRGITDPATLGALAVREALALTNDLNLRRIHIASHYKVVIDDIDQATDRLAMEPVYMRS